MDDLNGRLKNTKNTNQSPRIKCLAICSAGLLRSSTISHVLMCSPYNTNARACGSNPGYALIKLDEVLIEWTDVFVCASDEQVIALKAYNVPKNYPEKKIYNLHLPDMFEAFSSELIDAIHVALKQQKFKGTKDSLLNGRFNPVGTQ